MFWGSRLEEDSHQMYSGSNFFGAGQSNIYLKSIYSVTALSHFLGLGTHDDHIGFCRQRDMKPGLKFGAEMSDAAFDRS